MKRFLIAPFLLAGVLALQSCKKSSSDASPASSSHGSITLHGKTGNFAVVVTAPTSAALTLTANSVDTDTGMSVGLTIMPAPSGTQSYDCGTTSSGALFVVVTSAAKDGSSSKTRYYGANGDKLNYTNGTVSGTNLSEVDISNSTITAIPNNGKLTFSVKP